MAHGKKFQGKKSSVPQVIALKTFTCARSGGEGSAVAGFRGISGSGRKLPSTVKKGDTPLRRKKVDVECPPPEKGEASGECYSGKRGGTAPAEEKAVFYADGSKVGTLASSEKKPLLHQKSHEATTVLPRWHRLEVSVLLKATPQLRKGREPSTSNRRGEVTRLTANTTFLETRATIQRGSERCQAKIAEEESYFYVHGSGLLTGVGKRADAMAG